jgi:hypothetical protein
MELQEKETQIRTKPHSGGPLGYIDPVSALQDGNMVIEAYDRGELAEILIEHSAT